MPLWSPLLVPDRYKMGNFLPRGHAQGKTGPLDLSNDLSHLTAAAARTALKAGHTVRIQASASKHFWQDVFNYNTAAPDLAW